MRFTEGAKGAFEGNSTGASMKKIAAFSILTCVVVAHVSFIKSCFMKEDFSLLPTVLTIDFSFITACLGIGAIQSFHEKKLDIQSK